MNLLKIHNNLIYKKLQILQNFSLRRVRSTPGETNGLVGYQQHITYTICTEL